MSQDNWQHRSAAVRCVTCMWYCPKPNPQGVAIGRCRRHAPTMTGFPVVYASDWCGDHTLDETALPPPAWDTDGDGLPVAPHDPETCTYCQNGGATPFNPEG